MAWNSPDEEVVISSSSDYAPKSDIERDSDGKLSLVEDSVDLDIGKVSEVV